MLHAAGERGGLARVGVMSEKLRQMERLRRVRETRERLDEAAVARVSAKLHKVETRLSELQKAERAGACAVMCAMEAGRRTEWKMPLALRDAFQLDCERAERERVECIEGLAQAQELLLASRIHREQAALLYRDVRDALLEEEERRTQTETVDRFLARRRWRSDRLRVRSLIEVA